MSKAKVGPTGSWQISFWSRFSRQPRGLEPPVRQVEKASLTWHMHHATLAVLHHCLFLTLQPASSNAVSLVARQGLFLLQAGLAAPPRLGQVCQLQEKGSKLNTKKKQCSSSDVVTQKASPYTHMYAIQHSTPLFHH